MPISPRRLLEYPTHYQQARYALLRTTPDWSVEWSLLTLISIDAIVSMSYHAIDQPAVRSATTAQARQVTTTGLARPRHWTLLMHGFPAGDTIGAPSSMIALHDPFSGCIHARYSHRACSLETLQHATLCSRNHVISLKAKYSTRALMTFRSTDTGLRAKISCQ